MRESITWVQRRGQIKHLLYELCLTGRIDRATLAEQFKDLNSVEPKKHGRWEQYLNEGLKWKCSRCGSRFATPWHYCPNCGAQMDLDEVEE